MMCGYERDLLNSYSPSASAACHRGVDYSSINDDTLLRKKMAKFVEDQPRGPVAARATTRPAWEQNPNPNSDPAIMNNLNKFAAADDKFIATPNIAGNDPSVYNEENESLVGYDRTDNNNDSRRPGVLRNAKLQRTLEVTNEPPHVTQQSPGGSQGGGVGRNPPPRVPARIVWNSQLENGGAKPASDC